MDFCNIQDINKYNVLYLDIAEIAGQVGIDNIVPYVMQVIKEDYDK